MRKLLSFAGIWLLAILPALTSFKPAKEIPPVPKAAAPYQIVIYNDLPVGGAHITSFKVGSYPAYTGLNIAPGGSATFGEITPISGNITLSVTCNSAWSGTIEYYEFSTLKACGVGLNSGTHYLMVANAQDVYLRVIHITNETRPC